MKASLELQVQHALRRLSIRGWSAYDNWTDVSAWGEDALEIVERIRQQCEVGRGDNEGRWRLSDSARREVFAAWSLESIKQVLKAAADNDADRVTHALSALLGLRFYDLKNISVQQLADLLAATEWLPAAFVLPERLNDLSVTQLHQAAVRDDYKALTKHGVFGRKEAIATIQRHINTTFNPTVYLTGKGGSGKSTALAILRQELHVKDDCIVVLLDFDRPELTMKESSALDRELIAELGRAVPQLAAKSTSLLKDIRHLAAEDVRERLNSVPENQRHLRDVLATSYSMTHSTESMSSSSQSLLFDLMADLATVPAQRMVLLLDTFERVENAGTTAVETVNHWLEGIRALLPMWNIANVLSGRGKSVKQIDVTLDVSMEDLSPADARALLVQQECPKDIAERLVALLPGRTPLILLLAADAVRRSNAKGHQSLLEALRAGKIPAKMIEGYLYHRILRHLDDPIARRYAIASVILPELSLDVVAQVLVPVTEPGMNGDINHANRVFDALKNVGWLVGQTSTGRIRLRAELRSTMLSILRASGSDSRKHQKLRRQAISYHQAQGTPWDTAMCLYHKLLSGADGQVKTDKALLHEIRRHAEYLVDFADELPEEVVPWISRQEDQVIDLHEAIDVLSDAEWQRLMEGEGQKAGKGQYLVDKVDPVEALQLFNRRPTTAISNPPTFVFQAMCDTAQWDDQNLSIRDSLYELVSKVERRPKVWRDILLRLQWLTRLVLFRNGAGLEGGVYYELGEALQLILNNCSLYGVTVQLADTFAMAEALYGRPFFKEDIFQRKKARATRDNNVSSVDLRLRSLRLSILRNRCLGGSDNPLVLPWEVCAARDDFMAILEKKDYRHFTDSAVAWESTLEGPLGAYQFMHGASWVEFQRYFRSLKDYQPLGDWQTERKAPEESLSFIYKFRVPIGLWPEFYRPLRQVWMEDLKHDVDKLSSLAGIFNRVVRITPKELGEAHFVSTVSREPRTWFFVLAQHADRAGKLLELLDAMIDHRLFYGVRLVLVRNALREWQRCFRDRPLGEWTPEMRDWL